MKRYVILFVACVLWFAAGFIYGGALVDAWRHGYGEAIIKGGLWTPANEQPRGECVLPEVDMKNARELLPREIHNAAYYYAPDEPEKLVDVDGWQITETEAAIVKHTNEFRARNGRKPLKVSRKLMGTARRQAWQQTRSGMRHGYTSGWRGENIAAGQRDAREAVNAWINSSGHRANMLGNHTYIGVAGYGGQWAQQFD
jgi:hypothetical protein